MKTTEASTIEQIKKAEESMKVQLENDKLLVRRLLEIYDQKAIAEKLRAYNNDWSRESLNRWLSGKATQRALTE